MEIAVHEHVECLRFTILALVAVMDTSAQLSNEVESLEVQTHSLLSFITHQCTLQRSKKGKQSTPTAPLSGSPKGSAATGASHSPGSRLNPDKCRTFATITKLSEQYQGKSHSHRRQTVAQLAKESY